jgi:hypothetical protein
MIDPPDFDGGEIYIDLEEGRIVIERTTGVVDWGDEGQQARDDCACRGKGGRVCTCARN